VVMMVQMQDTLHIRTSGYAHIEKENTKFQTKADSLRTRSNGLRCSCVRETIALRGLCGLLWTRCEELLPLSVGFNIDCDLIKQGSTYPVGLALSGWQVQRVSCVTAQNF